MAAQRVSNQDLFTAYNKVDSVREMVELTSRSDDELYQAIGSAARATMSTLTPPSTPERGDYTAKAPFFFRQVQDTSPTPAVYLDLPSDPTEAGKTVFEQLGGAFDRVVCETVSHSPLYGYKQEEMTLGMQCVEALSQHYPSIDQGIVKAYVALRTKHHFSTCTRW